MLQNGALAWECLNGTLVFWTQLESESESELELELELDESWRLFSKTFKTLDSKPSFLDFFLLFLDFFLDFFLAFFAGGGGNPTNFRFLEARKEMLYIKHKKNS